MIPILRVFLLSASALFAVVPQPGTWTHYSYPAPVRGIAVSGDTVWAATDGGARMATADGLVDRIFTSADGLSRTALAGVMRTDSGRIVGVDESGAISAYVAGHDKFEVWNTSLSEKISSMESVLLTGKGNWILISTPQRLSFFRISDRSFYLTLTRVGDLSLDAHPVSAVLLNGDTAFLAIDSTVYWRVLPFSDLESDRSLPNPETWSLRNDVSAHGNIRSLALRNGKLVADTAATAFVWEGSSVSKAVPGIQGAVVVAGDTLKDDLFIAPASDSTQSDTQSVRWMVPADGGGVWLATPARIGRVRSHSVSWLPAGGMLPWPIVTTLSVDSGVVTGWSTSGVFQWDGSVVRSASIFSIADQQRQQMQQPLKTLAVDDGGGIHLAVWGWGIERYRKEDLAMDRWYMDQQNGVETGYCIGPYGDPGFDLVRGMTRVEGLRGVFFSYWSLAGTYGIGWVDPEGNMRCMDGVGSTGWAGAMVGRHESSTGHVVLYSAYSNSAAAMTSGGIDRLEITDPELTGSLQLVDKTNLSTGSLGTPRDMTFDTAGTLWAVGFSQLGYEDADSLKVMETINGVESADYTALEADPAGGIWLASSGKGVWRLTYPLNAPDSLSGQRWNSRKGLLGDYVLDIAVDRQSGDVWFAHNIGLSRLSSDWRAVTGFGSDGLKPRVYPNPFRPDRHAFLVFDRIPTDAEILLYAPSGNRIMRWTGTSLTGGVLRWDGRIGGRVIAAGVYRWVVLQGETILGRGLVAVLD